MLRWSLSFPGTFVLASTFLLSTTDVNANPTTQGALDSRVKAAVCYFPTDIHSATLGPEGDDTLVRASKGEFGKETEVVMIFGTQDGHVVSDASSKQYQSICTDTTCGSPFTAFGGKEFDS